MSLKTSFTTASGTFLRNYLVIRSIVRTFATHIFPVPKGEVKNDKKTHVNLCSSSSFFA